MALKNNYFYIVLMLLFFSTSLYSQYTEKAGGNTFYYDDDDLKKDQLNFHNVFYSGFSISLVKNEQISLPALPTLYFEYKYLFLPKNDKLNFSGNINPHIALFSWFLVRLPVSINVNFLNEANTKNKEGLGFSFGAGYEYVATTFELYEHSQFVQLGIRVDNVKIQYQYKLKKDLIFNHSISIGVQLNL
jgi:hypothetical protein